MNRHFVFKIALLASLLLPSTAFGWNNLVVSADKSGCPNADYATIQAAINAVEPGGTIHVCAGLYPEQLAIAKPLSIQADNGAVLMPGPLVANASSTVDGAAIAAAIIVSNTHDVSITGLVVDGVNNGITECAPKLEGIMFQNASGSVIHTTVRNFKLAAYLNGCQSGTGIFAQSGGGQVSVVTVEHCSIHDFQKNGITGDEIGTTVYARHNFVTGLGPTTGAAQNGIQIGFGAQGSIAGNTIADTIWSPCNAVATCEAVATGILVTGSDGVEVLENRAGVAQIPIYVVSNNVAVLRNEAYGSAVFDAIRIEGNENAIVQNRVVDGVEAGVYLMGNNNFVLLNSITEAPVGVFEASGSSGNVLLGNDYFDVLKKVHDPASQSLASLVQPDR